MKTSSHLICVHSEPCLALPYLLFYCCFALDNTHIQTIFLHPSYIVVASHRIDQLSTALANQSKIETNEAVLLLCLQYPLNTLTNWRCLGLELVVADLSVPGSRRLEGETGELGLAIRGKRDLEINIANTPHFIPITPIPLRSSIFESSLLAAVVAPICWRLSCCKQSLRQNFERAQTDSISTASTINTLQRSNLQQPPAINATTEWGLHSLETFIISVEIQHYPVSRYLVDQQDQLS